MANPYREPPPAERIEGPGGALALPTVIFGVICALVGFAYGGAACGLAATISGVLLLLAPSTSTGPRSDIELPPRTPFRHRR